MSEPRRELRHPEAVGCFGVAVCKAMGLWRFCRRYVVSGPLGDVVAVVALNGMRAEDVRLKGGSVPKWRWQTKGT